MLNYVASGLTIFSPSQVPSRRRKMRTSICSTAYVELLEQKRLLSTVGISLGVPVNGTLNPANSTQLYSFSGVAGQVIYVHAISLSSTDTTNLEGSTSWTLLDQYGNQVFQTGFGYTGGVSDAGRFKLAQTGSYTLAIQGAVPVSGTTKFSFEVFAVTDTSTILIPGKSVSSSLTTPGEYANYTINVSATAPFWFDSQTNDNNMNWELTGPQGIVRNSTPFSFDDQNLGLLPIGSYTLTVFGNASHVGPYAFNLLNLTNATGITVGTSTSHTGATVSGTLTSATGANAYQFSAIAGDQYQFHDISVTAGTNTLWELLDPWGAVVFNNTYLTSDQSGVKLQATGTYTLVVGGPIYATVAANYSFQVNFQSHTTRTLTGTVLAFGKVYSNATNAIGATGEADFQFTLPADTRLWFDSQTNSSSVTWELIGPQGIVSTPTAGKNPVTFNSDDQNLGLLPHGPYSLKIFGSAGAAYAFQILNQASATTITPGTVITATSVTANSAQVYQFNVTAGAAVYFSGVSLTSTDTTNNGYATWVLLDPYGTQIFNHALGTKNNPVDTGRFTLTNQGSYKLIVQGAVADQGTSTFKFNAIPVIDTTTALTVNAVVSSSLTIPSQAENYTFNLNSPTSLYFNSLTNNGNLYWQLVGPKGIVQSLNFAWGSANLTGDARNLGLLPKGSYTLTVKGNGAYTAPYSFNLLDLSSGASIAPGTAISRTLNPIPSAQIYQLTASANQTFYFNSLSFTSTDTSQFGGGATWQLLDPYGHQVFWSPLGTNGHPTDAGRFTLANAGTYTLIVLGGLNSNNGTSTYKLNVIPVTDATTPLTLGSAVTGNIAMPGQYQNYSFTLTNPAALWFDDGFSHASNLNWTLTGLQGPVHPGGNSFISTSNFGSSNNIGLVPAGTYTLRIAGNGAATSAYVFRLLDLATATAITAGTLSHNTGVTTSGSLSATSGANLYKFNAKAGDVYTIHAVTSSGNPDGDGWVLLDPWGRNITGPYSYLGNDTVNEQLLATGTYTVLAAATVGAKATVNYTFQANFVSHTNPAVSGPVVAFGATYNSTSNPIGASGVVNYQFTLTAASSLWFDSLSYSNSAWQLSGPQGTVVSPLNFSASDLNLGLLQPGTYSLVVTGIAGSAYNFRILNHDSATAITPGTAVTSTLNPANSTQLYKFSGTGGQSMYFNVLSFTSTDTNAGGIADWQLYDKFGNRVFSSNFGANNNPMITGRYTLPTTGTYTLAIIGRIGDNNSSNYKFNVIPDNDTTAGLTVNTAVSGTISTPGLLNNDTFTLMTPTMLWFDSRTNDSNFMWTLTGKQGLVRQNRFSDDDQFLGLVPAGTYALTVGATTANGDPAHTGSYAFNLLDFAPSGKPQIGVSNGGTSLTNGTSTVSLNTTIGMPTSQVITVTNAGTAPLIVQPVTAPSGFSIVGNFAANEAIPAGGSASFTLELLATNIGTFGGMVTIGDNDSSASPFTFHVAGTVAVAPAPQIVVSEGTTTLNNGTSTLGFGTTTVGTSVILVFTVKNTGNAPLIVQPIVVPTGFTVINNFTTNESILPGASATFSIQLDAIAIGTFNFVVGISDNDDDDSLFSFHLTGTVIA